MRKRIVVIALGFALLATPHAATASVHSSDTSTYGRVAGTNGYIVRVYSYRHQVAITASRDNASASYIVHGDVTDQHLAADFGQFGSVDLTFVQRGKTRHPHVPGVPHGCHASLTVRPGVLRGSFSFHARDDVTAADAMEIPAKQATSKFTCDSNPVSVGTEHMVHGHRAVFLNASNSQGEYGTTFEAMQILDRQSAEFSADLAELIDGVDVYSSISARAPKSTFTYDVHKELASVAPPAPFSGSAELGRADNGVPTWTGDLAVDLPGYGPTPLTGAPFQANLGRGSVVFFGGRLSPLPGSWSRLFTAP